MDKYRYECKTCKELFRSKVLANQHILTVHYSVWCSQPRTLIYVCNICKEEFKCRADIKKEIIDNHFFEFMKPLYTFNPHLKKDYYP